MLTCELKINGSLISIIYIRNLSSQEDMILGYDNYPYLVEIYEPENGLKTVKIHHKRINGALALVNKAIKSVMAVKKDGER